MNKKIKKLCVCGIFAALIFVITAFVSIPAGTYGNINLGDAFIIIATFLLGPLGAVASGIGAMIADLIGPYAVYAPATLVIKILMSIACFYTYKGIRKILYWEFISKLVGTFVCETIMVLGYFLYEYILYGFSTAVISIPFNLIQGITAIVLGTSISYLLLRNKGIQKFIDYLK